MLIPILDFESIVQVGDLTRLDASKSIKTKDVVAPISAVKIACGEAAPINVWVDTEPEKWFLDWVWSERKWDIDATKNKIYFVENIDGAELVATIPEDEYTLEELVAEIEDQMNAVGGGTYSVNVDDFERLTISEADGFSIKLQLRKKTDALLSILGFGSIDVEGEDLVGEPVEGARRKIVLTVETTTTGGTPVTDSVSKTFYTQVISKESDYLFSDDDALTAEEPAIMSRVQFGRASFLNLHRRAQGEILEWLDRNGYRNAAGEKLTKWNIVDRSQVAAWSAYLVLKYIFSASADSVDDLNQEKAAEYEEDATLSRNRALLELALTKEAKEKGKSDKTMSPSTWSGTVVRR